MRRSARGRALLGELAAEQSGEAGQVPHGVVTCGVELVEQRGHLGGATGAHDARSPRSTALTAAHSARLPM